MIRFIGSLQLSYRRIGNEKATVYFQLFALKYRISNNLLQGMKKFRDRQITNLLLCLMISEMHCLELKNSPYSD